MAAKKETEPRPTFFCRVFSLADALCLRKQPQVVRARHATRHAGQSGQSNPDSPVDQLIQPALLAITPTPGGVGAAAGQGAVCAEQAAVLGAL